jgi:hypothetical protein
MTQSKKAAKKSSRRAVAKSAKAIVTIKPRNPVARSPLLRKGGAHQKSEQALRKQANDALRKRAIESED